MRFVYLIPVLAAVLTAGCNIVYKQDIQQGNILAKEDVESLQIGMTKRQVLGLLGSPSIDDPFHQDRWDYVATFAPRGANMDRTRLTLRFQQDKLAKIEGDYLDSMNIARRAINEIREGQVDSPPPAAEPTRQSPVPTPEPTPTPPPTGGGGG